MTKFVYGEGFALQNFHIGDFAIVESDALTADEDSCLVESEDGFDQLYHGTGFGNFDPETGVPTTGTIASWTESSGGIAVFTMTKLNQSWEDYWGFVNSGRTTIYKHTIFRGADTIVGGRLDDQLHGFDGDDTLKAGHGDDFLLGYHGHDVLVGGKGRDLLRGDQGADGFVYNKLSDSRIGDDKRDTILDFGHGADRIVLHQIDADTTMDRDQAFFLGGQSFSGTPGELIFHIVDTFDTDLEGDVDGDGIADFAIRFRGHITFVDSDFIF
jgi:Ca2+-binding RTX toxin-like protein